MKMKKYLFVMLCALFFLSACSVDDNGYQTYKMSVQVTYPSGRNWNPEGVTVTLKDSYGTLYNAVTDQSGKAEFSVPVGIYQVVSSDRQAAEGYAYYYNGLKNGVLVSAQPEKETKVTIDFTESKSGQIIIKELYIGGCQKLPSGAYSNDKYCILYNNSDQTATLENLCFGFVLPINAHVANDNYTSDGTLNYESEGFIPAGFGIWYFQQALTLEPGKQAVVAIYGAIDHTVTYPSSVNLSKADYCMYDIADFSSAAMYPAPDASIPTEHYLLAEKYGQGTAWAIGNFGPGFFIFTTEGTTPEEFAHTTDYWYNGGSATAPNRCLKIPTHWILDAVEVFNEPNVAKSKKRLTVAVDAGYTLLTQSYGHTSYRNVDKKATEAIPENEGKLVYGYRYGEDPNGIDAEASLKNGARIVYMDTNNSTNDFHQRSQASLKD